MPFRLAESRRPVRSRGDGERYVHPKLLDAAAMEGQVDLALAYFHARLGRKRRDFEPELLVRFFGEPKVARGLVACLSATYRWRAQSFADVLAARDLVRLGLRDIHSPSELRLHLFDVVNQEADGFLAGERDAALLRWPIAWASRRRSWNSSSPWTRRKMPSWCGSAMCPNRPWWSRSITFRWSMPSYGHCVFLEFPAITGAAHRALVDACRAYGVSLTEQDGATRVHNRADAFGNFARWGQRVARALYAAASVAPSLLTSGRARVQVGGKPAWYVFDRRTLSSLTGATGIVRCATPWPEFAERWQRQRPAGGAGGWQLIGMAEPLLSAAGLAVPPYAMRRDERQVLLWPVVTDADGATVQALHGAGLPCWRSVCPVAPRRCRRR